MGATASIPSERARPLVDELLEGQCRGQVEGTDPGAPQAGQVPPDTERLAEVARDGPDVGPRAARHVDVDVDMAR